jgi:hypothetical protein
MSKRLGALPAEPLDAAVTLSQEQLLHLHRMSTLAVGDLSEGLEAPVQLLYLVALLGFLVVGAYLVVRQVIRFLFCVTASQQSPERS